MSNPTESSPAPGEPAAFARAALKLGLSVPEVEKRLVARGLTPATATALVNSILEEQVANRFEPVAKGEKRALLHRLLSGIVACGCIILAYWYGEGLSAAKTFLWVLWPLFCIWPEEYWAQWTPQGLLRLAGWVLLLLIAAYRIELLILVS